VGIAERWMARCLTTALCGVVLGGVSGGVFAAEKVQLKDCALADPVNALGPIAPNGTWATDGNAIVAAGTAAPWTIQVGGDAAWTDYKLSASVTIRQPGPKTDKSVICHSEWDRYLPREWYPPMCQHTGQYRYRYYAGEFDWGSEAAVFFRYQDRENGYRVQLSTEYQELILWHGLGGYLQVVPCELKTGQTYKVDVLARGKNIQVMLDGVKKIDYWHRTLPTLAGKVGMGAYRSTVAFQDVTVTLLPAATVDLPPHKPRFRTGLWRTARFIFDGNEPICLMERTRYKKARSKCMYFSHIKLVPGYRAYMNGWIGVEAKQMISAALVDEYGIKTTGENSEELVLEFDSENPKASYRVRTTDRITFDRLRGTYRHDVTDVVDFTTDVTLPALQFFDPLTFNNKEPGRGVKHRWLPAGHKWGLIRGKDRKLYYHPNTQGFAGNASWPLSEGTSLWMLYPDRAGCPAFEYNVPGATFRNAICHWGYDWHQSVIYGRPGRAFKNGERVTIRHAFTAYPPRESERMFEQATLHPVHLAKGWRPMRKHHFNAYCSPHAYPICDPAGTDFTRVYNTRTPSVGFAWAGRYQLDRTVGHNDTYSLRLEGPAKATGLIYHHMIDINVKKYLCTLWLKTRGVKDASPTVTLQFSFAKDPLPRDTIETGLAGDTGWQKFSFVTTVPVCSQNTYDSSDIILELKGKGTVWLDDFSITPIEDGQTATDVLPKGAKITRLPAPPFKNLWKKEE